MEQRITDAFRREVDGSWTCIKRASYDHQTARMEFRPGMKFGPEDVFMGVKVAKWLDSLMDARRFRE
jgi:hypothetical protein